MLFISRSDVESLAIDPGDFATALEAAFRACHGAAVLAKPKSNISRPDGTFLVGALGCWAARGYGVFHSIMGTAPENVPAASPHYSTVQLLSDYATARPLALIDGTVTSTLLPACVTAIAARRLARGDSRIAAFVAAGVQARVNLAALAAWFPLAQVRIASRTRHSAQAFAVEVEARGIAAVVSDGAEAAIRGADIVVTSVPGAQPFIDPAWVSPGAFVSAVDVGRSWQPGLAGFDRLVTDDRAQMAVMRGEGRFAHDCAFDTEMPELLAGARPGRQTDGDRIMFIHPGNIVGILAMTMLIYERARTRGLGRELA
jgi:ornithine cyclodeaminase/alanine dehydrogenase-like protein (mu-crystallin family)